MTPAPASPSRSRHVAAARPAARPASLKVRALQWLAQREHSRSELRRKLLWLARPRLAARRGAGDDTARIGGDFGHVGAVIDTDTDTDIDLDAAETSATATVAAEVDAVLTWLETHGYLSDARFAESRVNARQAGHGNLRIRQELKQHGVDLDADTQQALAGSEFERACLLWQRKYSAPARDAAERVRQMRFLAGRGFSLHVVRRVVRAGGSGNDDEAEPS